MRRMAVAACALAAAAIAWPAWAQEKGDVLAELQTQLQQLRQEVGTLRQENARLQATVAQQQQAAAQAQAAAAQAAQQPTVAPPSSGPAYPPNLFADDTQFFYTRPGNPPPSWIDLLIEQNRIRTMESWARARAGERLSDDRLARIAAESRAVGTSYCPRVLREAVLAGEDPKTSRDRLVNARTADFDHLFEQPQVQDYLKAKQSRLTSFLEGDDAPPAQPDAAPAGQGRQGYIAPANVRLLADRITRDLDDATILFGGGVTGQAPAGARTGMAIARQWRDSPDPRVSGPTRDVLDMGRRKAAVEAAVSANLDIEVIERLEAIRQANRRMAAAGGAIPIAWVREDLMQVNAVLNGKIMRTAVPEVQLMQELKPGKP